MPRCPTDDVLESQLYALLAKYDQIETLVPNIEEIVPRLVSKLGGYRHSTKARTTVTSLVFFSDVQLYAEELKKTFNGQSLGVPLIGGGKAYGTLYYDDPGDFAGKSEIQIITSVMAININFLQGGKKFATYIGVYGGISAANGIFTGSGKWDVSAPPATDR